MDRFVFVIIILNPITGGQLFILIYCYNTIGYQTTDFCNVYQLMDEFVPHSFIVLWTSLTIILLERVSKLSINKSWIVYTQWRDLRFLLFVFLYYIFNSRTGSLLKIISTSLYPTRIQYTVLYYTSTWFHDHVSCTILSDFLPLSWHLITLVYFEV